MTDAAERAAHTRLIGTLLAGPFLLAAAVWMLLPAGAGLALTLAIICATFGTAWTGVLLVASTGRAETVGRGALLLAAIAFAVLIAAAGGIASPLSITVVALPLEAWMTRRTQQSAVWGALAAFAALCLGAAIPAGAFDGAGISAWHWLMPLAYAATIVPRLGTVLERSLAAGHEKDFPELESVVDGVVVRLAPDGDVLDAGQSAQLHFGLDPELLHGTGLFDRIHIADRLAYLSALADLRDGVTLRRVEIRLRLPHDGDAKNAETHGNFAIELTKRDATSAIVTGLIRNNDEIARLRADLVEAGEASERLDLAKSRFLAAVSHELRTPLNSIIGFSDMLLHEMFGAFGDPRQKEYVELVRDSGHHLLAVVNSILDVSKMEAGSYATNPEPFRFSEAVEMCNAMMSVQAEAKAIRVTTQVAAEIGEIRADRRAVQQILINLMSNAVKFTPNGGAVTVSAKRLGSRVHLWVSDTGIGIAEVDLERLGRPFTQVQNEYNRQFEGTGLGLSLVKGLVALHEGTMTIDSALDAGTTVTITLPVDGPGRKATGEGAALLTLKTARTKENVDGTLRKAG